MRESIQAGRRGSGKRASGRLAGEGVKVRAGPGDAPERGAGADYGPRAPDAGALLAPTPDAGALLAWYDRHRRSLPWRAEPGQRADPYHVWLSEIMLQQTVAATVVPYFRRFLGLFPTVEALAAAPRDAVLRAWAGLGYYARARNLHECARAVAAVGGFPRDVEGLRALPGVGDYTADAIAAIAFGMPRVPVDGNVVRVAARLFAIEAPLPGGREAIGAAARSLGEDPLARGRASDFAQALFDLGATVCRPAAPDCLLCPWRGACAAHASGIATSLPAKVAKPARPARFGVAFLLRDAAGRVLLRDRDDGGLLGGMAELPGTKWGAAMPDAAAIEAAAPMRAEWRLLGSVDHVFTHFSLRLAVYGARVARIEAVGRVCEAGAVGGEALPSVMRKCLALG